MTSERSLAPGRLALLLAFGPITPQTLTLELPFDLGPDEARLLFAIKLFEDSRVSLGYAADMAGYSTRAFMEILDHHGVPAVTITEDDLAHDLAVLASLDRPDGTGPE